MQSLGHAVGCLRKRNVPTALSLCSGNPHDPDRDFLFLAEIFDVFILIFMKLSETSSFQILLENIIS